MSNKFLYTSIGLIIAGIIGRLYAAQYTHITADGILRDSFWLPLGTLLILLGLLMLIIWGLASAAGFIRRRMHSN